MARRSALCELQERDSFLRHWYTESRFASLGHLNDPIICSITAELRDLGMAVLFSRTYLGHRETIAAFIRILSRDGFVLGLSAGRGVRGNVRKALIEAAVNLYFGHQGKTDSDLRQQFEQRGIQSLIDHRT